jgi:hypothetical protein
LIQFPGTRGCRSPVTPAGRPLGELARQPVFAVAIMAAALATA